MTTFIHEVGICGPWLGNTSMLLLSILFDRACPQHILFLCSPDGNGVLSALTIHVPELSDWICSFFSSSCWHLVLIKKPFWMVARPRLQKIICTVKGDPKKTKEWGWMHEAKDTDLDFVVFEKRVIKGWLMRDVHTVNNIPIWTLFNHHMFGKWDKGKTSNQGPEISCLKPSNRRIDRVVT